MRDAGVLINRTGPRGDVLKIRPPLVFGTEHVELLCRGFDPDHRSVGPPGCIQE